jgi:uncharacterized protein (TIGR03437 family)
LSNARIAVFLLAVGVQAVVQRPAAAQSDVFSKILDGQTQRTDGLGRFFIDSQTMPAFDGRWVVFRDPGPRNDDGSHAAIWSYDTRSGTFHKLVDLLTPIPAGDATFHDLQLADTAPTVRNGLVIFLATDTKARHGLYSVPADGSGPVRTIADSATADPTGGTFTVFDPGGKQAGAFSFDGTTVAFYATGTTMIPGVYTAGVDGSSLALLADSQHPAGAVNAFSTPVVAGHNAVLIGGDGAVNGAAGLYLAPVAGGGALTQLLSSTTQLPGYAASGSHARFDAPVLALDGSLVAFHATNVATGVFGLYAYELVSRSASRIADSASTLPGLGKLQAIALSGAAVSRGSVVFRASDTTGAAGLYIWKSGAASRIAGSGDMLDGRAVQGLVDPGPAAIYGSAFVFTADFGSDRALYLATPAAGAPALASVADTAANASAASIAPGEIVTLFGADLGPATLAYSPTDADRPSRLAGVRILFNGVAAPLLYVYEQYAVAIAPFGLAGAASAEITVEYNGVRSNAITVPVTNTRPGVFSLDSTGGGQGAINNLHAGIYSCNTPAEPAAPGGDIVLWVTGLGLLDPAPADGSRTPVTGAPAQQFQASVTIGGLPARITWQGPAPAQVAGLYQINCVIPAGVASGRAAVVVTADGRQSQPNLWVSVR